MKTKNYASYPESERPEVQVYVPLTVLHFREEEYPDPKEDLERDFEEDREPDEDE